MKRPPYRPTVFGIIIAGVFLLGYVLARKQALQQIAAMFLAIANGPVSFLIAVNLMVFVLGMLIELRMVLPGLMK